MIIIQSRYENYIDIPTVLTQNRLEYPTDFLAVVGHSSRNI
jgi:hypothetical protein